VGRCGHRRRSPLRGARRGPGRPAARRRLRGIRHRVWPSARPGDRCQWHADLSSSAAPRSGWIRHAGSRTARTESPPPCPAWPHADAGFSCRCRAVCDSAAAPVANWVTNLNRAPTVSITADSGRPAWLGAADAADAPGGSSSSPHQGGGCSMRRLTALREQLTGRGALAGAAGRSPERVTSGDPGTPGCQQRRVGSRILAAHGPVGMTGDSVILAVMGRPVCHARQPGRRVGSATVGTRRGRGVACRRARRHTISCLRCSR
jgi:hypothetical protein